MASAAEVETFFGTMLHGLAARGYVRSEMSNVRVRLFDEVIALLSLTACGTWADGAELERFGVTYVVRWAPAGWRIVFTAVHLRESAVSVE